MVNYHDYRKHPKDMRFLGMHKLRFYFTKEEINDLLKSWLALSLAFTMANISGYYYIPSLFWGLFLHVLPFATISAALVFITHELGHKFTAEKHGVEAHYKANNYMLILSIVLSLSGFLIFAPGAVIIQGGYFNKKKQGIIAAAGPLINILIATISLLLQQFFYMVPFLGNLLVYLFSMNAWIALFNMIPLGSFDGKKILVWNKLVFAFMVLTPIILLILNYLA
ncbi:MAG: peptidase M50 [Promethearchaeota archaeon]